MVLRYRLSRKVADLYLAWSNSLSGHVFLPCAHALLLDISIIGRSASLGDALAALNAKWPNEASFAASEVANIVNNKDGMYASDADVQASQVLREVLYPKAPRDLVATGIGVGKLLRRHIGEPVRRDGVTLILKDRPSTGRAKYGTKDYYVQARDHDIF